MNKKLLIIMAILLIVTLAMTACGPKATADHATAPVATSVPQLTVAPTEPPPPPVAKHVIAVCLPTIDNPMMLSLQEAFKSTFGSDYDVQIASADGNAATQASQVENFTAMRADFIFVMPVESSSLVPMLIAARQAGINVLVAGGNPDNRNAYTAVMLTNQFLAGSFEAWMAKQWIDETYPNASEGSIETAILESTLNADAVDRSAGMKMLIQPFLKNAKGEFVDATGIVVTEANKVANPAYTLKVKVVQIAQAEMFQAGRTAMQDILITNPKVKVVLAYTGDAAMGASQAILDEFARGSGVSAIGELSKVAVFGVGMTGLEGAAILDSASNKTVFRGTIRIGGDVVGRTMEYVKLMLTTETEGILYDPLEVVTVVGGKLMALPVVQNKFFTVPDGQPIEIKLDPPLG